MAQPVSPPRSHDPKIDIYLPDPYRQAETDVFNSGGMSVRDLKPSWPQLAVPLFVGYALLSLTRPMRRLVVTVADDASYYFRIAREMAAGHGPSFDSIHLTNGFHPLWQLLLTLVQGLTRSVPETQVRLALILQIGLLAVAGGWIWSGLKRTCGEIAAVIGLVAYLAVGFLPAVSGMETALVWFVLAGLFARAPLQRAREQRTWRRGAEAGAWLGLLVLSRVDLVFHAVLGLMALTGAALPAGVAVCALLLGPYLAWNRIVFKHVIPISGALKASFPRPGWHVASFQIARADRALLVVSLAACLVHLFRRYRSRPTRRPASLIAGIRETEVVAIGAMLHACYCAFFVRWGAFGWYFVPERFALVVLASRTVAEVGGEWLKSRRAMLNLASALLLASTLGFAWWRDWKRPLDRSWHVAAYDAAGWARVHLPKNAVLAMKDAGHFSLFSERPVINLDGLVNNFDYQDELRQGRFADYLKENHAAYLVQHAFADAPDVGTGRYREYEYRSYSQLYRMTGGSIRFTPGDEVYRSPPYCDGPNRTVLVIFRLPGTPEEAPPTPPEDPGRMTR